MTSLSRNVPLLYVLKATNALGFMYPIWYLFEQQFLTITQIAIIEVILVTSKLVMEIPTGAIADIFGYKVSMILSHLTMMISLLFFVFAHSFSGFLVYAIIFGLSESLNSGADEAMEYETFRSLGKASEFARIKNKFSLVFQISLATAFITGGIIADRFGYQTTIWLTMGSTFLSLFLTTFMIEPSIVRHAHTLRSYLKQWRQGYDEITKTKKIKAIAGFYSLVGGISWPVNVSLLVMYLAQMQLSASNQGILLGIVRIANILLLTSIIRKTNHHNNVPLVMLAYVLIFAIGYVPAFLAIPAFVPVTAMIILISTTARWNVIGPLVHHQLNPKNRATAMSTLSMTIGISHAMIMGIAALLLSSFGGPKVVISLMGVIGVIGTLWLRHHYKKLPIDSTNQSMDESVTL